MEFESKVKALSERIESLKHKVETEEATKNSFIMPLISALGYDVFDLYPPLKTRPNIS